ncbi:GIP [Symbiodinium sp. CCMP2456]|nr:GIP [Symbiodinium sp. CCMP2456]
MGRTPTQVQRHSPETSLLVVSGLRLVVSGAALPATGHRQPRARPKTWQGRESPHFGLLSEVASRLDKDVSSRKTVVHTISQAEAQEPCVQSLSGRLNSQSLPQRTRRHEASGPGFGKCSVCSDDPWAGKEQLLHRASLLRHLESSGVQQGTAGPQCKRTPSHAFHLEGPKALAEAVCWCFGGAERAFDQLSRSFGDKVGLLQLSGLLALLDLDLGLLTGVQELAALAELLEEKTLPVAALVRGTATIPGTTGADAAQVKWAQVGRFLVLRTLRERVLRRWCKAEPGMPGESTQPAAALILAPDGVRMYGAELHVNVEHGLVLRCADGLSLTVGTIQEKISMATFDSQDNPNSSAAGTVMNGVPPSMRGSQNMDGETELWDCTLQEAGIWYSSYLRLDALGACVRHNLQIDSNPDETKALDLIRELEDIRLRRFEEELQELECHMHALDKPLNPTEAVQRYIDSGDRGDALRAIFCQPYLRDLPEELKVQLAEQLPGMTETAGKQILKRLPLKRAKRRALLASNHWVVHLCSGSEVSDDPLKAWTQEQGFELLQVDVLSAGGKGWNLLKNYGVWSVLLWAAASGRISAILASPPKSSFEAKSPLAVQDMFLWTVASVAKGRGVPYFRCSNLPVGDEGLRQAWIAWSRMAEVPQTPKSEGLIHIVPMSVITNLPLQHLATESFEFMGNGRQSHSRACGRWTMRLRSEVVQALRGRVPCPPCHELDKVISDGLKSASSKGHQDASGSNEGLDPRVEVVGSAGPDKDGVSDNPRGLKPHEASEWRAHIANGHVPYRRDCRFCIEGAGLGIQHRRVKFPQSFSLSVDLFGPLPKGEHGRDEQSVSGNPHVKYGLVGAFRVPRSVVVQASLPQDPHGVADLFPSDVLLDEDLDEYEPSVLDDGEFDDRDGGPQPELESHSELFRNDDGILPSASAQAVDGSNEPEGLEVAESLEDWGDKELPSDKVEFERLVEELSKPVDMVVLRYFVALKSKTGADVANGIQRMILSINKKYPVQILHCDQGTEFTSSGLNRWMTEHSVRVQHSLPTDKKANGLAERTVGWVKSRVKTLITSSKIDVRFWPLAARWAVESHNRRVHGEPSLPAFGQDVLHKLKRPSGAIKDFSPRWIMTRYMAPHISVPDGHVLLTGDGNLVSSKGFRSGVIDPSALEEAKVPPIQEESDDLDLFGDEEEHESLSVPLRRVTGKSSIRFVGYDESTDSEALAISAMIREGFDNETFAKIVDHVIGTVQPTPDRRGEFDDRIVSGAYCHGGIRGMTKLTHQNPNLTRYVNSFLRSRLKKGEGDCLVPSWTALMIMRAADVPVHKDFRNEWGSLNHLVHVPGILRLWVHPDDDVRKGVLPEPDWESPSCVTLANEATVFDARKPHAVQKTPDWVIVGYTPLGSRKIDEVVRVNLEGLGFTFGCSEQVTPKVRMVLQEDSSSSGNESSPEHGQGEAASVDMYPTPLESDLQEDANTPIIGWDFTNGNPGGFPQLSTENQDLLRFLRERGVEWMCGKLKALGIETPEDLTFLFLEDLIEFGIPEQDARRAFIGIHPVGIHRPDNPNNCGLTTGEVRLFDRQQRQIPWIFQNRTLGYKNPPPPIPGLGVRTEGRDNGRNQRDPYYEDWVELNDPYNVYGAHSPQGTHDVQQPSSSSDRPPEIPFALDLFEESSHSQAHDEVASGSTCIPNYGSQPDEGYGPHALEMLRLQRIWDEESEEECDLPPLQVAADALETNPVIPTGVEVGFGPAEIPSDLFEESSQSSVHEHFGCRMLEVSNSGQGTSEFPGRPSSPDPGIGVPTGDPIAVFRERAYVRGSSEVHFTPEAKRVEEDMYTPDVESILEGLTSSLRVVHNVAPSEVKNHLSKWHQAALSEVNALEGMKGIRRLVGEEAVRESRMPGTQILPAKTVFTVKPGSGKDLFRRKCRVVACGNFEARDAVTDVYASGIPADVLRACLIEASARSYGAYITDVKNAFLLASIPESEKVRILLRPPRILELLEITQPGELWYVERAIYGLRQSPRWWQDHRNAVLSGARWQTDHGTVRLVQSSIESNLWTLVTDSNQTVGYAIVYVDDLMILASPKDAELAYAWIRSTWECTPLQAASPDDPITFLGVEIHVETTESGAKGFALSQKGYVDELMRSYQLPARVRASPLPREWVKELPEEEAYDPDTLRRAQKVTGELLWISQRSRIDIAYPVALMGSWCTRSPGLVVKMGLRILEYLGSTSEHRLSLTPEPDAERRIKVYTDASFSPYGSFSVTGVLIMYLGKVVLWKGKRQTIVSLSTAEAELVAACEGTVLGQSVQALVGEFTTGLGPMLLLVDNVAAITIAEGGGSLRTRHLRVRGNFIKDLNDRKELEVVHCPGDVQLADGLTKVLPPPRHQTLSGLVGLGPARTLGHVAAVAARDPVSPRAAGAGANGGAVGGVLMTLILLLQFFENEAADESSVDEPLSLELSALVLMLVLSILFIWETGKQCLRVCLRPSVASVQSVRPEEDNTPVSSRRARRQDAVRRAIDREVPGLRRRNVDESSSSSAVPEAPPSPLVYVDARPTAPEIRESPRYSVLASTPNYGALVPPPPPPQAPGFKAPSSAPRHGFTAPSVTSHLGFQEPSGSVSLEGPASRLSVPHRGLGVDSPSTREIAVQTEESRGLSHEELGRLQVVTTSSRTPGAVHLFPTCHALRGVAQTQRRTFCRYCLQAASRTGI